MSKKHFIALADAICEHNKQHGAFITPFTTQQLDVLADFLQAQNPRFNRARWVDYVLGKCGPSGGSIARANGFVKTAL